MLCDDLEERDGGVGREALEGRIYILNIYIYIVITDLSCYTAETNTRLSSNYPPIKKKKNPMVPLIRLECLLIKVQLIITHPSKFSIWSPICSNMPVDLAVQ